MADPNEAAFLRAVDRVVDDMCWFQGNDGPLIALYRAVATGLLEAMHEDQAPAQARLDRLTARLFAAQNALAEARPRIETMADGFEELARAARRAFQE